LFGIIGETYGVGDGSTTFNLPNLENRVPVGVTPSRGLGTTGGSETHALTESEMPRHEHFLTGTRTFVNDINVTNSTEQGNASPVVQSISFTTASVGSTTTHTGGSGSGNSDEDGLAHNNMQPFIALKYIIKT
jgi:microcystin-dependent protein